MLEAFFYPELAATTQAFFRTAYGLLLAGTLLEALPHGRRFFLSERWGGYAKSSPDVDLLQNPVVYPFLMAAWLANAVLITVGWWPEWAALFNLIVCRIFFVRGRWKGVLRGMGAPGFMTYWMAACVFLLEYTLHHAPHLRPLALLAVQADFAFIMLSSGLYKLMAGYPRNEGMELGMVNPQWGFWWEFYKNWPPRHGWFRLLNHMAWSLELLAAVLMFIPPLRLWGGLLISASFVFVGTQIRLSLLAEKVVLCGALFVPPGCLLDRWIAALGPLAAPSQPSLWPLEGPMNALLAAFLWAYVALLPLAHGGLWVNFYGRRSLWRPLQRVLERYTNFFGMIVWRVFSADLIDFFIQIYREPRAGGPRTLVSRYGWKGGLRYNHVAESIAVSTVFTTLRYYPSGSGAFQERLLRYARTVPCGPQERLLFEYVRIVKERDRFAFVPVREYAVDVAAGTVEEKVLDESFSVKKPHEASPAFEGARPGSYVPLTTLR